MHFILFRFFENFCFSFRTSRNVHLMNIQYMKLEVVHSTDIVSEDSNSFTYVLPSTCHPKKNINNDPQGIA